MSKPSKPYVRESTGLVRELGGLEAFGIGFGQLNFIGGTAMDFMFATYLFMGASLALSALGALVPCVLIGLVYWLFAISMPRSGGDYVYISRVIHPAIGFMVSFFWCYLAVTWMGLIGWVVPTWTLPSFLGTYGLITNNAGMIALAEVVASNTSAVIIGTIWIAAFTLLMLLPIKNAMRVLIGLLIVSTILFVPMVWLMATTPVETFASNFNAVAAQYGTSYDAIIELAVKNDFVPGFSMAATIGAINYAVMFNFGWTWPVYAGGEIKNIRKSIPVAIFSVALLGCIAYFAVSSLLYYSAGFDFIGATAYLFNGFPQVYPLPREPTWFYLGSFMTKDPFTLLLIHLSMIVASAAYKPTFILLAVRSMFAWSFDRLAPEKLADVSQKYTSPVTATVLCGVLGWVCLLVWIYTDWFAYESNQTLGMMICFVVVGIAGMVFPYTKKELFESSPQIVKRRIAGIPTITIAGALATIAAIYLTITGGPNFLGAISSSSIGIMVGVFLVPIILYYISRAYRRTKGIDIELSFKEIPPE